MAKPTKTQIKEYLNWLPDDFDLIKKLYQQTEEAYLILAEDTLSDEFQIVANILDVFSEKTEALLTLFAPDPPSALPSGGDSTDTAGG